MIEFIDKTSTQEGTRINRATMMAIQGFVANTIEFLEDGSILETNGYGDTKKTIFNIDGSVLEIFSGEKTKKTITKKTSFDGEKIEEVIL